MKIGNIAVAIICGLLMSNCMTVSTGYGPHGAENDLIGTVSTKRNITFSVDYAFDVGEGSTTIEEDAILAIREQFTKSGLFGRVDYVLKKNAGPYHYHFRVESCGNPGNKLLAALLSICTYTFCPVWMDSDLNWTMSYIVRGKEINRFTSQQTKRNIVWMPCAVVTPFMNNATTGQGVYEKPLWYFIRQIRERKLNDIQ